MSDSVADLLQVCRKLIETDIADLEECDRLGGCGDDHKAETAKREAVLERISQLGIGEIEADDAGQVHVSYDTMAALLYSEFTESTYASSWMDPSDSTLDEFEQWLPGAVESRMASTYVQEQLPKLREICQRALRTPAVSTD